MIWDERHMLRIEDRVLVRLRATRHESKWFRVWYRIHARVCERIRRIRQEKLA